MTLIIEVILIYVTLTVFKVYHLCVLWWKFVDYVLVRNQNYLKLVCA